MVYIYHLLPPDRFHGISWYMIYGIFVPRNTSVFSRSVSTVTIVTIFLAQGSSRGDRHARSTENRYLCPINSRYYITFALKHHSVTMQGVTIPLSERSSRSSRIVTPFKVKLHFSACVTPAAVVADTVFVEQSARIHVELQHERLGLHVCGKHFGKLRGRSRPVG